MSSDNVYKCAISRRTSHIFKEDEFPRELIKMAVEAAVRAPNHKMTWPWKYVEIGKSKRRDIADIIIDVRNATSRKPLAEEKAEELRSDYEKVPVLIAAVQKLVGDEARQKEDFAACACAIQNFSLVMWENDVSVKWSTAGGIADPRTYELLGLDSEKETIIGFLWVGYSGKPTETNRPSFEEVYVIAD